MSAQLAADLARNGTHGIVASGPVLDTFLKMPAVLAAAGVGRSTLYEMMDAGKFPKPVKPSEDDTARGVRWLASEVAEWQRSRITARDNAA
jgi:prophage regulatory protein